MDNYLHKVIVNRYEIQEIIGIGGMAVVYKAYDRQEERIVAIKILKDEYLANEEFRLRFKNESTAIAMLSHPNIVKVFGVNFGINLQYIVMEYVEGITLKEYIERQGVLDRKEALHFIIQILRALQHAHDKGIVHRDVKPQNILLLPNATIKVTDFGIARFNRAEASTANVEERSAIGSVHYISPEQAQGGFTDGRSDIYSAGIVLYEMLTGRMPFEAKDDVSVALKQIQEDPQRPRSINPDIPEGLEQIVLRAMQKDPADRYQSAAEFLSDLYAFKNDPDVRFDYEVFIDKDPTKYITGNGKLAVARQEESKREEEDADEEEEEPQTQESKNITIPVLIGVAVALVLAVALILGIAFSKPIKGLLQEHGVISDSDEPGFLEKLDIFGWFSGDKIEVPNFLNMEFEAALDKYPELAIKTPPQYVYNTTYEAGRICEQFPEAGKKITPDTVIRLTVATNTEMVLIEETVKGMMKEEAKAFLTSKGLKVELVPVLNADAEEGVVISTDPGLNSYAEYGSRVTVFYASEKGEETAEEIPAVVGYQLSVAEAKITAAGFKVGVIDYDSSAASQKDYVIRQTPSAGESIPQGTAIDLVIGTGVPKAASVAISVDLPRISGVSGSLKAYLDSGLYDTHSGVPLDGRTDTFTFTGSNAGAKYQIYLEGTLISEGTIDFTRDPPAVSSQRYAYTQKVRLPDVVGLRQAQAREMLSAAGFSEVAVKTQYSDTVEKDFVIAQSPVSSDITQYATNTPITLTVSLGREEPVTEAPQTQEPPSQTEPETETPSEENP